MNFSTLATKPPSLLKTEADLWKLNDIRLLIDNVNLHYVNPDQHVGRGGLVNPDPGGKNSQKLKLIIIIIC